MPFKLSVFIRALILLIGFTSLFAHASKLDEWKRYTSDHMILYTDYDDKKARKFIDDFEVFRAVVINLQKGDKRTELPKVSAYLFSSESLFQYYAGNPNYSGFFTHPASGPIMAIGPNDKNAVRETLFHEYVHFILNSAVPIRYSAWYSEGIAEFFSTMVIRDDFVYVGRAPESAAYRLSKIGHLKVKDLFEEQEIWTRSNRFVEKFYGSSWLVTHFVTLGARNGFPSYYRNSAKFLQLQSQGVSVEEAFNASFDVSMSDFGKQIKKYSRINNREGVSFPLPIINTKYKIETLSESRMAVEMAKLKGINKNNPEAYEYYEAALAASEPLARAFHVSEMIEDRKLQSAFAELALLADVPKLESETLYRIALAYSDLASLAAEEKPPTLVSGREKELREKSLEFFLKSNDADIYVPTLVGIAYNHHASGNKAEALAAVNTFVEYSPSNLWALMQAATIAFESDENALAERYLNRILKNIHAGEWAQEVQELLDLIRSGPKARQVRTPN